MIAITINVSCLSQHWEHGKTRHMGYVKALVCYTQQLVLHAADLFNLEEHVVLYAQCALKMEQI